VNFLVGKPVFGQFQPLSGVFYEFKYTNEDQGPKTSESARHIIIMVWLHISLTYIRLISSVKKILPSRGFLLKPEKCETSAVKGKPNALLESGKR
jgi:hypothetical protein